MISKPLLMVLHDFLPQVLAGTELYVARIAPHVALRRPVHLLYTVQAPGEAQFTLRRGSFQGLPTWEIVQNHPFQPLERACHDPALEQVLHTVLEHVQPAIVHIHHLSRLSLRLPTLARTHGARVFFTLHDYHLLCPSGGQRAAHPDGERCETPPRSRCAECFSHVQQQEGALERLGHALSRGMAKGLPAGLFISPALPFELYRRLPTRAKVLLQRLNPPSPVPALETLQHELEERQRVVQAQLLQVERLISPSAQVLRVFRASGLSLPETELLPNPAPSWSREPLPSRGPLRLLFVGTLTPHKGAHVVLEGLRSFPPEQVQVGVVGALEGDARYLASLQRLAGPGVQFWGRCTPEQVRERLHASHALVLGSLWEENAPLTVLEALSLGRPVLAPQVGGLPELIQAEVNGLLYPPGDRLALAACVQRLLTERGLLEKLAEQASPPMRLEQHLARLEQLYQAPGERERISPPGLQSSPVLKPTLELSHPRDPRVRPHEYGITSELEPFASVVLLTYNGGPLLREVLQTVLQQRTPWPFEVLVLDSASEDGALQGLEALMPASEPGQVLPCLKVRIIPQASFQHGRTRNLGARLARGAFVVYLVQDATPVGSDWLVKLVEGLAQTDAVGGYARQVARPEADEALRERIARWTPPGELPVLRRLGPHERWELLSPQERLSRAAFDDVCSVLRRDWLLSHPFEEVPFGEDLLWGAMQLREGQALAYLPMATVIHSHQRSFRADFERARLEHRLLARAVGLITVPDLKEALRSGLGLSGRSWSLPAETRRRLWAEWLGQTLVGWECSVSALAASRRGR
ncbi:MAG: glycosyltransferase [Myxococcota bacterium]